MTIHNNQLYQAISQNPEDDATRLIYADWLEENGNPERAEFIRIQCEIRRIRQESEGQDYFERPEYSRLLVREEKLLQANWREWIGPISHGDWGEEEHVRDEIAFVRNNQRQYFVFERGWVDEVLFRMVDDEYATMIAESESLRLVRKFYLYGVGSTSITDPEKPVECREVFRRLGQTSTLSSVREVHLGNPEMMSGMLGTPFVDDQVFGWDIPVFIEALPRLEELVILGYRCDLDRLFALDTLHNLNRLILEVPPDQPFPLATLAQNPSLAKLEKLEFDCETIFAEPLFGTTWELPFVGQEEFLEFVRSPHLVNLKVLRLCGAEVGVEGCRVIVESGFLRNLEELGLHNCSLNDEALEVLASCPHLPDVELMNVANDGLDDETMDNDFTEQGLELLRACGVNVYD